MAYVKQRNSNDCGVAALAMLCDVTYEEAERVIPWRREGGLNGTTTTMLSAGAKRLGYRTKGTKTGRLKVVKRPVSEDEGPWSSIPANSLVKILHPKGPDYGWHWVVWRKNKIYDPARGVFRPAGYSTDPSSYLEFYND